MAGNKNSGGEGRIKPGEVRNPRGRPAGYKLLATKATVAEAFEECGDSLLFMARVYANEKNEMPVRLQAAKEVSRYAYAPRKEEDQDGDSTEKVMLILDMPRRAKDG